ncbi:hypothetical protein CIB84_001033 [Bambusicola thoracicus]|uniref:Uncharacterized protein n=1 Tax=Bambusicola thoracicus TaxID=9083 RepID=A0A2P4TFY0_BAMTH|nr:hypothetical protein CIB84_001033 [Bambusicola thoracicus]
MERRQGRAAKCSVAQAANLNNAASEDGKKRRKKSLHADAVEQYLSFNSEKLQLFFEAEFTCMELTDVRFGRCGHGCHTSLCKYTSPCGLLELVMVSDGNGGYVSQDPIVLRLRLLQADITLEAKTKINLEFYIDIHAHSTMMNGFMYGNIFENEERFQRQAVFPKLLCQNAEDFSYISSVMNDFEMKCISLLCIRNMAKLQALSLAKISSGEESVLTYFSIPFILKSLKAGDIKAFYATKASWIYEA